MKIIADETAALTSEELGVKLRAKAELLQLYRVDTGERLLTAAEHATLEAQARQREAEARLVAEAEVARLHEELARRPSHAP